MAKKVSVKNKKKVPLFGRGLAFVLVAGAVSGYLLYRARSEPNPPPPNAPASTEVADKTEAPQAPLSVGDALPSVSLLSLSGERLELRPPTGARPVLLYIFSPQCSVCHEILPVWKELFDEAKSHSVEVVGISVLNPSRTATYVREFEIPWNVFCMAGRDGFEALRLERVPVTILLESGGEISLVSQGRLDPEMKEAISERLRQTAG